MSAERSGRNARDWAAVHRRISEAVRRTEEAIAPTPDRARQILDERACSLAEPVVEASPDGGLHVVSFGLGGATYLIESRYVREVLQAPSIVPVPRTPDHLAGLANVRGELVPVFVLQAYYRLSAGPFPTNGRAAILGQSRSEFAILVDWIEPASYLPAATIVSPSADAGDHQDHVQGLTAEGQILLNGAALLEERDLYLQS